MTTKKLLTGLLIDPYKKRVESIEIAHDLQSWYQALRCNTVDVVTISEVPEFKRQMDIWIDDNGLLHEPVPPTFRLQAGGRREVTLAGYGLVLGANTANGETVSLPNGLTPSLFCRYTKLQFEQWEGRLDVQECISQVMRSIELEMPGRFRYVAQS